MKQKIYSYIDAMIYGDSVTKRYLYGIVLLTALSLGFAVTAIAGAGLIYGLGALLLSVMDLIWWQSMTLTSDELIKQGDKERYNKEKSEKKEEKRKKTDLKKREKEKKKKEKEEAKRNEEGAKIKGEVEKALGKAKEDAAYTETSEEIKYTLRKYKVKKDHREIIIDSCESLGLKESPAYIWKDKKKYYLLIIGGKEPVKLDYPLEYNTKLVYLSGKKADPDKEYMRFKKPSIISLAFSPFLPDYYQKRTFAGTEFCKNLYRLGKDMYFTNTSAKNVFDIVGADFEVNDAATEESRHGEDFKNAYKANILWRDGVISSEEYKKMITGLLSSLARADIRFDEFNRILEQMYEYNFITKAYVEFYINYRRKYRSKKGGSAQA